MSSKLAVLMCTFNGEKYLNEQIASIHSQQHECIDMWVSDDGSNDNTLRLLEEQRKQWKKGLFSIKAGPQQGFAANFLSLICDPEIQADYYGYSDQDDIWEIDKLERARNQLDQVPEDIPALYCSRTRIITESGQEMGLSPLFEKSPDFANAIIQSLAGGNTMVMNKAAKELLCQAGPKKVISHDWWTYMLVSGAGGYVVYDRYPTVRYRQHEQNQIGANSDWRARLERIKMLKSGRFKTWNDTNISALTEVLPLLSEQNKKLVNKFAALRQQKSASSRVIGLRNSGIYRQTAMGNLALVCASLLKKL